MPKFDHPQIPEKVHRRIRHHIDKGEKTLVLTVKNGVATTVYDYHEYKKKEQIAKHIKPWEYKKEATTVPDPLGAVEGDVLGSLSRSEIYD